MHTDLTIEAYITARLFEMPQSGTPNVIWVKLVLHYTHNISKKKLIYNFFVQEILN